jgi:hypothetical protein
MNDQVLADPEPVTGVCFDGQSDPPVPTHIAEFAVLGQVSGHDFVTVEANPNDRDLRTSVGFDGDQVGQPPDRQARRGRNRKSLWSRERTSPEDRPGHASAIARLGLRRHRGTEFGTAAPGVRQPRSARITQETADPLRVWTRISSATSRVSLCAASASQRGVGHPGGRPIREPTPNPRVAGELRRTWRCMWRQQSGTGRAGDERGAPHRARRCGARCVRRRRDIRRLTRALAESACET